MKAVDLFAGFGGFTAGARAAGIEVVWAGNHWRFAVDTHTRNHPEVDHACQDLRQFPWHRLPDYDLLLASPACQRHSTASQPRRDQTYDEMRSSAWAVIECADITNPAAILVENVPAFTRWRLFETWCAALRAMGYVLDIRFVQATHYGVPQLRNRVLIAATYPWKSMAPLVATTPEAPAFGPCIDWDAPGWRPRKEALPGAQARMAAAVANHGPRVLSQHTTGHRGVPLHEPIRTITTQDQWVLVDGDNYRPLTMREYARGQGFAEDYTWDPRAKRAPVLRGIGNAIPPPLAEAGVLAIAQGM